MKGFNSIQYVSMNLVQSLPTEYYLNMFLLIYISISTCLSYYAFTFPPGDPDAILKVPGRREINYLNDWTNSENLQLLNLM